MNGFHIAPFSVDGEAAGVGFKEFATLLEKWLGTCSEYLKDHGQVFDDAWSGPLSHLHTKWTAAHSTAVVMLSARDVLGASMLLMTGKSPAAEAEVAAMFVASLRRADTVHKLAARARPFEEILHIRERPVMVVIPWAFPEMSEVDSDLVRELSQHLAAAFFASELP